MSKHQGIIEFLAISGILPLAVILLCFIGGMFFLILCIFIVLRNKKQVQERKCYKCKSGITKGKPICSVYGHLNI